MPLELSYPWGLNQPTSVGSQSEWGRMSLSELPPISSSGSGRRPGSGRSRRSSTHSQGSGRGGTGTSVGGRVEQTEIRAINGYTGETKKMIKRTTCSPGSTGGSSGQPGSNGTGASPRNGGVSNSVGAVRSKTWGTNDNANGTSKVDSKLETLFEQKTSRGRGGNNGGQRFVGDSNEGSGELFQRTKSFTNLSNSKGADTTSRQTYHGGKGFGAATSQGSSSLNKSRTAAGNLTKVKSEQNIASAGEANTRNNHTNSQGRTRHASNSHALPSGGGKNQQHRSLRISKSTPNFVDSNTKGSAAANNNNSSPSSPPVVASAREQQNTPQGKQNNYDHVPDSDRTEYSDDVVDDTDPKEEEREQRIIDWLIGVENERPERPESPSIIDEEPTQTDTAIHIVYNGE